MKKSIILLLVFATAAKSQLPFFNSPVQTGLNTFKSGADLTQTGINKGVSTAQDTASSFQNLITQEWKTFSANKNYASPEEEKLRFSNFVENRKQIESFNEGFKSGVKTFVQSVNSVTDMLFDEFNKLFNGYKNSLRSKIHVSPASTFTPNPNMVYPDHVDWREAGAVSPVKYQGACASCWAFAATGAIEGHTFNKTGRLIELSPQNLVDCSTAQGNEGCDGGLMEPAYESVKIKSGLNTHTSYPYEAKNGECRFEPKSSEVKCTGYVTIPPGDEKGLEAAVATMGPVAVAMHVVPSFQFYKSGIFYDPACSSKAEDLNHALLVVGYGKEANGQKYWLLKNSYGTEWGMEGYIKMAKDQKNHCGIATQATYPLI